MGTFSYIKNFLKDPGVASITPTSRYTVDRICRYIDFTKDIRIIELGPADGVFTKTLLNRCTSGSSLVAIETNADFVKALNKIDDDRLEVAHCSAEKVGEIAESRGWDGVDYILSGIPFSFLDDDVKNSILKQSAGLVNKEGGFLGYQTSAHLKPFLKNHFPKVATEMEYLNIPPMCIYIAKK